MEQFSKRPPPIADNNIEAINFFIERIFQIRQKVSYICSYTFGNGTKVTTG